jgi:hypothetical protein
VLAQRVEVSGFIDPEEDIEEVVVTQYVNASPQMALNYWDKLGTAIEIWTAFLPESLRNIVVERLAVEVRWATSDAIV